MSTISEEMVEKYKNDKAKVENIFRIVLINQEDGNYNAILTTKNKAKITLPRFQKEDICGSYSIDNISTDLINKITALEIERFIVEVPEGL